MLNELIDIVYESSVNLKSIQRLDIALGLIIIAMLCSMGIVYIFRKNEEENNTSATRMIIHNHGKKW